MKDIAAIKIEDLHFGYEPDKEVIRGLSLSIPAGSYTSIIGHNGSGKSTLAKLIVGLLEAKSGTIEIFGDTLDEHSVTELRRKVGIVFQNPDNQFIGATVRDDIAFGLENRQVPRKDMDAIIDRVAYLVQMIPFLDKEPSNLSGGQKQRVAIAGVLAMEPEVVIFDEATAMLDPKGKREIGDIIRQMKKEKPEMTIISVTHDIEEAYRSDHIVVMSEGQIILEGGPDEVFSASEILLSHHLDQPFFFKMKKALAKRGLLPEEPLEDTESLVDYLCR